MHEGSKKAIFAAFCANLGIAAAKFVGFAFTRSSGMLAEAGHSLADTGNQALLLLGSKRSSRGEDGANPFGRGRERFFWSFIVALVLFSMGGLFALYEGIHKLAHPSKTEHLIPAMIILGVAVLMEGYSLNTAMRAANHLRPEGMSWAAFIRTTRSPELPVVLLEDIGAEVGLLFAFLGVFLSHITGNARWDAAASVAIGVLLCVIAAFLAIEMKSLLVGETASAETEWVVRRSIESHPRVRRIIHLRTQHLGPDELLVGVKVEYDDALTIRELAVAIDETEVLLRAAVPSAQYVYIEPDITRPAGAAGS